MDDVTAGLLKSLDIDVNGKPNALQDRAQWEWRRVKHSFSTKKRNKVIEDLRHWNEDLRRSVEKPELPAEDDSGKVQYLKRRFNIERCNSIRQCLSSLHRALEFAFRCACSPPHQAAIDLDWEAIESNAAKTFKVALSFSPIFSPIFFLPIQDVKCQIPLTVPDTLTPTNSAGFINGTNGRFNHSEYGIAASTAWSVLHLSGSPWLGHHWDEKQANIFLEKNQGGREILSRYPCASYTFLPPTSPEQLVATDFDHLIPNKTVFTLGILLIELCINKSFAECRQTGESVTPASLLDDYKAALSKLNEVYRVAGDSYGYATERCVKFAFQGPDSYQDFTFSKFRQQFYDAVVAPVQATYLAFPDSYIPV
ncbi:hypothetical protein PEX2_043360 [Penicillium expansum]|uniref:DUF7580 domain-containing protein n=1 Tax=Penicillium expansum TaxID=27334 RepID=A0A0A2K7G8_PENEN|nr:hypothetical protein PEX2_043360 [Penicillium expansum]KGO62813.1 hypothetical protein PEX2_043360 [Penicillium expansum]